MSMLESVYIIVLRTYILNMSNIRYMLLTQNPATHIGVFHVIRQKQYRSS